MKKTTITVNETVYEVEVEKTAADAVYAITVDGTAYEVEVIPTIEAENMEDKEGWTAAFNDDGLLVAIINRRRVCGDKMKAAISAAFEAAKQATEEEAKKPEVDPSVSVTANAPTHQCSFAMTAADVFEAAVATAVEEIKAGFRSCKYATKTVFAGVDTPAVKAEAIRRVIARAKAPIVFSVSTAERGEQLCGYYNRKVAGKEICWHVPTVIGNDKKKGGEIQDRLTRKAIVFLELGQKIAPKTIGTYGAGGWVIRLYVKGGDYRRK